MSSKVIRPSDPASAAALAWTPVGVAAVSWARTAEAGKGEPVTTDVRRDIDARVKAAYLQGQAEGGAAVQRASQEEAHKVEPVIARLNQIIQELAGARKRFRNEAEADTVKLAIAIARRLLHRELATDPDAILGLVLAAFQKLNARETHRLRVSTTDAALLQEHRARLDLPPGLEILGDSSLEQGSVVFETSRGELDASVSTQLTEIDRGFTDIIRRHAK